MNFFHFLGFSKHIYEFPVLVGGERPKTFSQLGFSSPAHTGPFKHAQDISVPDPRERPLDIRAPKSGVIVALSQLGTRWGEGPEYNDQLNFVTVRVDDSEFYEVCHIAAHSCPFTVGERVQEGTILAKTGLNGWTTVTSNNPDSHVHILVARVVKPYPGFQSIRIRFKSGK